MNVCPASNPLTPACKQQPKSRGMHIESELDEVLQLIRLIPLDLWHLHATIPVVDTRAAQAFNLGLLWECEDTWQHMIKLTRQLHSSRRTTQTAALAAHRSVQHYSVGTQNRGPNSAPARMLMLLVQNITSMTMKTCSTGQMTARQVLVRPPSTAFYSAPPSAALLLKTLGVLVLASLLSA